MRQLKIAVVIALAVILQSSLRLVWHPFVYVDLPLIVVVYFALQRDPLQAMVVGVSAGLGTDALSAGSLLGAGGFTKTVIAYLLAALANRINLDNPLLRIPVLVGAALLDTTVYILLHRMLGQPSLMPFVEAAGKKIIATAIAGTLLLYLLDMIFGERARQRRQFAFRRRVARRTTRRR